MPSDTTIPQARLAELAEHDRVYRALNDLNRNPSKMMLALSINRVLCVAGASASAAALFYLPLYDGISRLTGTDVLPAVLSVLITALLTALAMAVLTDNAPRLAAERFGEVFAARCYASIRLLMLLLSPLTLAVSGFTALCRRIFKISGGNSNAVTEEKILMLVEAGNETGAIEQSERQMINNIFDFDDVPVSEVMTHRTDLTAADIGTPVEEIVRAAIKDGFSRIPVYEGSIDNICGVVNVKDLLCLIIDKNISDVSLSHFMREVLFVPETNKCNEVFEKLSQKHMHIAVVVDEYGGTAGMVTMEDLIEEIVGNIQDEYDNEDKEISEISAGVFDVDGAADPEDIIPRLGGTLPTEHEYDTMSALYVDILGRIPCVGERPEVKYQSITLRPLLIEDNWVSRIRAEASAADSE